jgi:phosphate transport system substrate-binding protein
MEIVHVRLAILGLVCTVATALAAPAAAREQIRIVGSSTVFPFSTAVAEQYGRTSGFKTPVIESTGTGGGFKLFCAGVGLEHPDITNASRRIKQSEIEGCAQKGVKDIVEVKIGYDGIVIANAKTQKRFALTKEQVFRALAKQVPVEGRLVANPYRKWSDIDASLPDWAIEVLGPPPTSGTRDAFVELAMEGGAKEIPFLAELEGKDAEAFKQVAHSIREDGAYVEAGENDNLIVQKLESNPKALGVFGFSFLDQNTDRIQGSVVDGVEPTFENISSGKYGVSRSLYFYVKKAHVGVVPGIEKYIAEFTSENAAGPEGYLADKGLIPLPDAERQRVRTAARGLETLAKDVASGP